MGRRFLFLMTAVALGACSMHGAGGIPQVTQNLEASAGVDANRGTPIASIQILASPTFPLGQSMRFGVVAKDRSGKVISGKYDRPIVLKAANLTVSPSSIGDGLAAGAVNASWNYGFAGSGAGTITAASGTHVARATIVPGTGIAYYLVGNSNFDRDGFHMTPGPDGKIYYGTQGQTECTSVPPACFPTDGAVGQFDPLTGTSREIELHAGATGLLFSSDGALWVAGTFNTLFRLPPRTFDAADVQRITVPPPAAAKTPTQFMWSLAQDGSGRVWFDVGRRLFSIPVAGPYQSASLRGYSLPNGPSGTPSMRAVALGLAYAPDGNLYVLDAANGVVDRFDPVSGRTTAQLVTPQQSVLGASGSSTPRFVAVDGAGDLLLTQWGRAGTYSAPLSRGSVESLAPKTNRFKTYVLPKVPNGPTPDSIATQNTYAYYADPNGGLGYIDAMGGASRYVPVVQLSSMIYFPNNLPNGVLVMPDGSAWFTCSGLVAFPPLCIGHTVYLSRWSIFPGSNVLVRLKQGDSQAIGIMESPAQNSGPFVTRNDNPRSCSVGTVVDHNFSVSGKRLGTCSIEVRDARGQHESLTVTVASPIPSPVTSPTPPPPRG